MAYEANSSADPHSMIHAQIVAVLGGTFIQHPRGEGRQDALEILTKKVAHTAFHNSAARFDPPKCHPNTRVAVLKKIMDWMHRTDWETWYRYIMWLTGAAGAGKSAIAQTIIELCIAKGLVIASFFFFRSDGSRNHGHNFVATLTYQIFFSIPSTQVDIRSAIDNDPLILTRSLDHQFDRLIVQPLRHFYEPLDTLDEGCRRLIVIDGLDECGNRDTQKQILMMLRNAIRQYELPVIFLVASRPEYVIKATFDSKPMDGVFFRLYLDGSFDSDEDIRTFLKDSFDDIKSTHPFKSQIPVLWPTRDDMESIVLKSSGQFIYAATVIRYIQSIRHQPHQRLEVIMNLRPAWGDLPFAQLDALYTMILSSAEDKDRMLYALSVYCHHVFDGKNICGFLSLEYTELEILFCDLASLVLVECDPEANTSKLRILHKSLEDFLKDPQRSKEYFISFKSYRDKHIINIFRYVTESISDNMLDVFESVWSFFRDNHLECNSSAKLMQCVSKFPLEKVFNMVTYEEEIYPSHFIFFHLCAFLNRMATLDSQWILIEKRQQEALDRIFLSQMPLYYKDNNLMVLLCFVCHAGENILIPWICDNDNKDENEDYFTHVWDRDCHLDPNVSKNDTLKFSLMNISDETLAYQKRIVGFLRNADRSGRYVLGADEYAKTSLSVIERLQLLAWTLGEKVFDESHMDRKLVFRQGLWRLTVSELGQRNGNRSSPTVSEVFFMCLGYMIFFLPLSGKSESLIQHCQNETFLTEEGTRLFPGRTVLVRRAMKEYLERWRSDGTSGEDRGNRLWPQKNALVQQAMKEYMKRFRE